MRSFLILALIAASPAMGFWDGFYGGPVFDAARFEIVRNQWYASAQNIRNQTDRLRRNSEDLQSEYESLVEQVGPSIASELKRVGVFPSLTEAEREVRELAIGNPRTRSDMQRYFLWNDAHRTALQTFGKRYNAIASRTSGELTWQDRLNLQNELKALSNDALLAIASDMERAAQTRAALLEEKTAALRDREAMRLRREAMEALNR